MPSQWQVQFSTRGMRKRAFQVTRLVPTQLESSMKRCVFTPSHETGIIVAHIVPYAGSHATRLGRESSWPQVLAGIHFFPAADGQGVFCALTGRAAFVFRGNVENFNSR